MNPQQQIPYVKADGSLTLTGYELLDQMARRIEALEAQVAALLAT